MCYQPHKAQTFGLYRILLLDMTVRFNGKTFQRRPFLKADFTCPPNRVRAGADQYSCKSSNTYPSINCNVFQHVSAMSKLGLLWKGCHQRNLSKHQVLQSNMQDIVRLSSLCCAKNLEVLIVGRGNSKATTYLIHQCNHHYCYGEVSGDCVFLLFVAPVSVPRWEKIGFEFTRILFDVVFSVPVRPICSYIWGMYAPQNFPLLLPGLLPNSGSFVKKRAGTTRSTLGKDEHDEHVF